MIIFIDLLSFRQDSIRDYMDNEIKNLEVRGRLISKAILNDKYILNIKIDVSGDTLQVIFPGEVFNGKKLYEYVVEKDIVNKGKGRLTFGIARFCDGSIDVRQFSLVKDNE